MHLSRRALLGATTAGLALTAAGCSRATGGAPELHALLDQLSIDILRESPEAATSLGVSEEQAGGRFIDRLADASREGFRRNRAIAERAVGTQRIERIALSGPQRRTMLRRTVRYRSGVLPVSR